MLPQRSRRSGRAILPRRAADVRRIPFRNWGEKARCVVPPANQALMFQVLAEIWWRRECPSEIRRGSSAVHPCSDGTDAVHATGPDCRRSRWPSLWSRPLAPNANRSATATSWSTLLRRCIESGCERATGRRRPPAEVDALREALGPGRGRKAMSAASVRRKAASVCRVSGPADTQRWHSGRRACRWRPSAQRSRARSRLGDGAHGKAATRQPSSGGPSSQVSSRRWPWRRRGWCWARSRLG